MTKAMEISVVIPLYNKKATIQRALDSVFSQSYQPKEIIVVNDGSTDDSERIVAELNHPLIQLVHQENAGVSAARNKGIDLALSEWVAFLDADDYWEENYLHTIFQLHTNYPSAKVLATNYRYQLHTGEFKSTHINNLNFGKESQGILDNYFQVAATSNPPIWSSAVVVSKSELQTIDGFPLGIKSGEDLITWARLASKFTIAYSLNPLAIFHLEVTKTFENKPHRIPESKDSVYSGLLNLCYEQKNIVGLKKYIAHWKLMRANKFIRLGQVRKSIEEILISLKYNPLELKAYVFIIISILPVRDKNKIFKFLSRQ